MFLLIELEMELWSSANESNTDVSAMLECPPGRTRRSLTTNRNAISFRACGARWCCPTLCYDLQLMDSMTGRLVSEKHFAQAKILRNSNACTCTHVYIMINQLTSCNVYARVLAVTAHYRKGSGERSRLLQRLFTFDVR